MGRYNGVLVALANMLLLPAILFFAKGFFPYKPSIPGLAQYEPLGWEDKIGGSRQPEGQFDRLVFMVVDALRSDFVFSQDSGMKFFQSLIRDGTAVPFTAHASSPTITQPRVKAMTTGSVPSFLDLILNFFESDTTGSLADQDTWLAQMKAQKGIEGSGEGKLVMYGDDTWLKLFPDFFARHDGTTSFFVSVSALLPCVCNCGSELIVDPFLCGRISSRSIIMLPEMFPGSSGIAIGMA